MCDFPWRFFPVQGNGRHMCVGVRGFDILICVSSDAGYVTVALLSTCLTYLTRMQAAVFFFSASAAPPSALSSMLPFAVIVGMWALLA